MWSSIRAVSESFANAGVIVVSKVLTEKMFA